MNAIAEQLAPIVLNRKPPKGGTQNFLPPTSSNEGVTPDVRRCGEQVAGFRSKSADVFRLEMCIECCISRPFLDECKICRVRAVLHQLVLYASVFRTSRCDQRRQGFTSFFDLVRSRGQMRDDPNCFCGHAVPLYDGRYDLANASLQLAVIGDGRDDRDLGRVDRRNAFCDHLRGVNEQTR